jgi:hypothetical protein
LKLLYVQSFKKSLQRIPLQFGWVLRPNLSKLVLNDLYTKPTRSCGLQSCGARIELKLRVYVLAPQVIIRMYVHIGMYVFTS